MIDKLQEIFKGSGSYMRDSQRHRHFAESLWLEDNIDKYHELYNFSFADKRRVKLNKLNNIVAG